MKQSWLTHYNILVFDTIDSTNSEALRLASSCPQVDNIIVAKEQTGGRGQRGSEWVSLPENLHASILLTNNVEPKRYSELSFLAANAVYEAISFFTKQQDLHLDVKLKWVNDVLISGKKVAGILLESISLGGQNYVVIGFGVNVLKAPKLNSKYPVTSLRDNGILLDNSDEFLNVLMNKFDSLYKQWCHEGSFIKTRKSWLRNAYNINNVVTIDDGSTQVSGVFKDINDQGAMQLQLDNGEILCIHKGTVVK